MSNYSADPGVPQTPTKAVVSTVATALVVFVGFWINDEDPFTKKEAAEALITAVVGSGIVGAGTYVAKNRRTA